MLEPLLKAVREYKKKPFVFIGANFKYGIFQLLSILVVSGVFFIFFYLLSILRVEFTAVVLAILGIILGFLYLYLSSGFRAALFRVYIDKKSMGFMEFFKYAMQNAHQFFILTLARLIFVIMPVSLILAVYFLSLKDMNNFAVDVLVGLSVCFTIFFVHFLFFGSYVSISKTNGGSILYAIKNSLRSIRYKHISVFLTYFLYALFWIAPFIPILVYLTLFKEIIVLIFVPFFALPGVLLSYPVLLNAQIEILDLPTKKQTKWKSKR